MCTHVMLPTFVILDPEAPPGVGLISLDVDVELVASGDDKLRGLRSGQLLQDGGVGSLAVPDEDEVPLRLHLQVFDLERDDAALRRRHGVEALEAAGVRVRVVRRCENLRKSTIGYKYFSRKSVVSTGC